MKITDRINAKSAQHLNRIIKRLADFPPGTEMTAAAALIVDTAKSMLEKLAEQAEKDRLTALAAMPPSNFPINHRAKWTTQEEWSLVHEYHSGVSIEEMARIHQRTEGSIIGKLDRFYVDKKITGTPNPDVVKMISLGAPVKLGTNSPTFIFDRYALRAANYFFAEYDEMWPLRME